MRGRLRIATAVAFLICGCAESTRSDTVIDPLAGHRIPLDPAWEIVSRQLASAARVDLRRGISLRKEGLLFSTSNRKEIVELVQVMRVQRLGLAMFSACIPRGVLYFHDEHGREIESFTLYDGSMTSPKWKATAFLSDPDGFWAWLKIHGLRPARYKWGFVDENARQRWRQAVPTCLESTWANEATRLGSFPLRQHLGRLAGELAKCYPKKQARVAALLRWYGSGSHHWVRFDGHEVVPQQLLFDYPAADIVSAVNAAPADQILFEGAARFFADPFSRATRPNDLPTLSPALKRRLLSHALSVYDADRERLAKAAYVSRQ